MVLGSESPLSHVTRCGVRMSFGGRAGLPILRDCISPKLRFARVPDLPWESSLEAALWAQAQAKAWTPTAVRPIRAGSFSAASHPCPMSPVLACGCRSGDGQDCPSDWTASPRSSASPRARLPVGVPP